MFPLRTKAIADALNAQTLAAAAAVAAAASVEAVVEVKSKEPVKTADAAVAPSEDKKKGKKEKKTDASSAPADSTVAVPATPATVTAPVPAPTPAAAHAPVTTDAAVDMSALDPTRLDIRIGKIVKCWNHPESTKLLCEEVDVGDADGTVRTIASGLREYYTAEEMVGKFVVVFIRTTKHII